MEKKKLQRIIGISVIVAIIIILIPFLFSKKESSPSEVTASAESAASNPLSSATESTQPAASTLSSADEDNGITPIPSETDKQNRAESTTAIPSNVANAANNPVAPPAQTVAPATQNPAISSNPATAKTTDNSSAKQQAAPVAAMTPVPAQQQNAAVAAQPIQATPAVATEVNDTVHSDVVAEKAAAISTPIAASKIPVVSHRYLSAKKVSQVASLKKPAWVVQMGSFKNQTNAHRLVDQLKTAGFKAFTKEITSAKGVMRTRVYIGPEFQEASALKLSNRIERETKLRGFVVPYKPVA